MSVEVLLWYASFYTLCSCCVLGDISLQRNGYTGVVVAVSPATQAENASFFFESLQSLFNRASRSVFSKLDDRAFIEEVVLILPKASTFVKDLSFSDSKVQVVTFSRPSYSSAQFVIEPEGLFGDAPYTLQFGPCGCHALRTIIPASFVTTKNGTRLAEEWLRLRYGVFSTEHFDGDPLFSESDSSKQDVLCQSSIRDTVLRSKDFHDANLSGESPWRPVTLKVVKEDSLRLVVLWNIGRTARRIRPIHKRTQNALKKFATIMAPEDSMMALVYFGEDILDGDDQLYSVGSEDGRRPFATFFPTTPNGSATVVEAINRAKQILTKATEPTRGGVVLLITEQNSTTDGYGKAEEILQGAEITLHALLLPQYTGDGALESLAAKSGGRVTLVSETDDALSLCAQADAVASLVLQGFSNSEKSNLILLRTEFRNGLKAKIPVQLPIDIDIWHADALRVGITKKTADPAFDNSITLVPPGNASSFTSRDKVFSETSDFSLREFVIPNPPRGTWTLKIDPRSDVQESVIVDVKAKPGESEDIITVTAWMSQSYADVDPSKPLLIYAEVRKGVKPIKGAAVEATVKIPTGGDVKFKLVDNGRGDPDITAGDGIYSRYFTGFYSKGSYDLSVTVKGEAGAVAIGTRSGGEFPCCGSEFPATPSEPTGPFARYSQYGSFITSRDRPPGDIFAPSRVTDLRVTGVDHYNMRVTLQWTAPGNDFDNGTADFYEIRYFIREVDFAAECETAGTVIESFDIDGLTGSPKEYGQLETATVFNLKCEREPERCYFALRANDKQNRGGVSNVVHVRFERLPAGAEDVQAVVVTTGSEGVENKRNELFLGLAIGVPIALVIIVVIIAMFIFMTFRKRSDKEPLRNGTTAAKDSTALYGEVSQRPPTVLSPRASSGYSVVATCPSGQYEELEWDEDRKAEGCNKLLMQDPGEALPPSSAEALEDHLIRNCQEDPMRLLPQGTESQDCFEPEQHELQSLYAVVNVLAKKNPSKRLQTFI